ncbi:glycosyltransferase family 32 protein [Aspergillus saccharolyticus JOP 1030-1]|uniref:Mannosyl phosphorylinositol ceramide synthase SUR1 n=1 Tax=Aspergillus saccharolyticus JOP 1030-1 TaxID=1450539 RepID=A0A318ZE68_9EURO|nr:hypothetical protein BP01DRAFT_403905 [Aspergillus saccharolyticus JOP 1030-1]PYH42983.1 hypothetical protein BP01DRAFT_403905 [Aspergillus saccharolyticus JOP 1030-1]
MECCPEQRQEVSRLGLSCTRTKLFLLLLLIDLTVVGLLLHTLRPLITLLYRNQELFAARGTLPSSNLLPQNLSEYPNPSGIPLILHQTAATENIPERWQNSQQSCVEVYANYQYMLWTDESARDFISKHYPWFLPTWDTYTFPIQRADALRYFVLYHYGGIYLDMDTWCIQPIPVQALLNDNPGRDLAIFKSTTPTGVTNDFLVTTPRHPVYGAAIAKLPDSAQFTHPWARLQPYSAIMASAGPMFLSLVLKEYLLGQQNQQQQSRPFPWPEGIEIINKTELAPYITDLESSTWHHSDAKVLMWLGKRPWLWYTLGLGVLATGLYMIDYLFVILYVRSSRRAVSQTCGTKSAKKA